MQNEELRVEKPTESKPEEKPSESKPEEKPSESKPEEKPSENKPEDKPSTNEPLTASDQSAGEGEKEKGNDESSVKQEEDTNKEEERPKLNVEKVWKYIYIVLFSTTYNKTKINILSLRNKKNGNRMDKQPNIFFLIWHKRFSIENW